MPKTAVELGSQAYLFKGAAYATNVVISAHGFYYAGDGVYNPGGNQLLFYCRHGDTVDDIPMSTMLDVEGVVRERVPGDNPSCTDYRLFKFQEHKADIKAIAKGRGWTFDEAAEAIGTAGGGETYATFTSSDSTTNDYVTVRNRAPYKGGPVIRLSALIGLISATHQYATYKCCFCRELKPNNWMPQG
jgi:hypothetical protein